MTRWITVPSSYRWPLVALFSGMLLTLYIFGNLAEDVWRREGFAWDALGLHLILRGYLPHRQLHRGRVPTPADGDPATPLPSHGREQDRHMLGGQR